MLHFLEVLVIGGVILALAFMILLALPQCKLRDMLMPWMLLALCTAYCLSPLDAIPDLLLPLGLADDFVVAAAGISTVAKMVRANRQKQSHLTDPYFNK
jgi:uncharacterized membrane protein YkvA (DUF1232 family)